LRAYHDAGLKKYEAQLLPHARLAFELHLDGESEGKLGESRWGGTPDVSQNWQWPFKGKFPMQFFGQINLADLISDAENPFPSTGLLQFFADGSSNAAFIALLDANQSLQVAQVPEMEAEFDEMPAHRLKIVPRADLPQWATSDYQELTRDFSDDEQEAYGKVANVTESGRPGPLFAGQLLGHVAGIGIDPREDASIAHELAPELRFDYAKRAEIDLSGARHWRNLAMFDSIRALDFFFGDAGYFGFLIPEDDLANLAFERIFAHMQSS